MSNTINPSFLPYPARKQNITASKTGTHAHPLFTGQSNKPAETKSNSTERTAYETPRPKPWLISLLNPVNEYTVLKGIPGLRNVPLLNQIPGIQGLLNIEKIDLPKADLARLKKALNPETIAFVGPNHPEFFTDWAIDKKIASVVAPGIAHWADAGIVNSSPLAKRFYLSSNLIANNGKEKAKADSIQFAIDGKGVLLHPEGRVWWDGDNIHTLYPGIVEMAVEAAKQTQDSNKPVYIVPISWKFHYPADVSQGLHRDMEDIEKKIGAHSPKGLSAGQRFFRLQEAILAHQEKRFNMSENQQNQLQSMPYFRHQEQFQNFLIQKLETKYGKQANGNTESKLLALEKAAYKAKKDNSALENKEDLAMLKELFRMESFSTERYNRPKLSQEHLYENIKRNMQSFFGGYKTTIPKPAGRRIVHIRVAEPINVKAQLKPGLSPEEHKLLVGKLLNQVKQSLQLKLDEVNTEIEPSVSQHRVKNEFYTAQPFLIKARL